jgi:hypothetical protein
MPRDQASAFRTLSLLWVDAQLSDQWLLGEAYVPGFLSPAVGAGAIRRPAHLDEQL